MLTLGSVWRVLRGPNNDWPLGLCDYDSVSPEDSIANDFLCSTFVGENKLLHANPNHRWYYLSDQKVDELVVFRNIDSKGKRARRQTSSPTPHALFELV